jgi:hypothetical protein
VAKNKNKNKNNNKNNNNNNDNDNKNSSSSSNNNNDNNTGWFAETSDPSGQFLQGFSKRQVPASLAQGPQRRLDLPSSSGKLEDDGQCRHNFLLRCCAGMCSQARHE